MKFITLDFETYYDQDYSLSKLTIEQYIRDPRFEVIGVGIKVNDEPAEWFSGDDHYIRNVLSRYDWRDAAVLCHHTMFDGAILGWVYNVHPKLLLDTLSMARPLHSVDVGGSLKALASYYELGAKGEEVFLAKGLRRLNFSPAQLAAYGAYCVNDVELTYKLFKKLKPKIPASELLTINQILRMFTQPKLELDRPVLDAHLAAEISRKEALLAQFDEPDMKAILMSNHKFAAYLMTLGVSPIPMKTSPTTGKQTWAFGKNDKAFQALLEADDQRVVDAVEARLGIKSTIEQSRTERLIGVQSRGMLPAPLVYYAAHTGRFGGGDGLNLQNLPRGGELRRSIKAPKGKKIVACDSSQIEARTLAWLAGQSDLVEAFRMKRDTYSEFATEVYGFKVDKSMKVERFVGKTCILGLGYGMGGVKLQRTLEIGQGGISVKLPEEECFRITAVYRRTNFRIKQLWDLCGVVLNQMSSGGSGVIRDLLPYERNQIFLPNGLPITYHALEHGGNNFRYINDARQFREFLKRRLRLEETDTLKWTYLYGAKVVENIVQALARLVVSEQMAAIGQRYDVALQVHDELVVVVDEDEAEEAKAFMEKVMSTPPVWAPTLPVACEAGIGDNYGEAK